MNMTDIGFTGTGTAGAVNAKQLACLRLVLEHLHAAYKFQFAHHGDCIEADTFFDQSIKSYLPSVALRLHPGYPKNKPKDDSKRAYCTPRIDLDICWEPKPFMDRNDDIVIASDALVAISQHDIEAVRSGTWATIRRAYKKRIPIFIIWPEGSVTMYKDLHLQIFNEVFKDIPTVCAHVKGRNSTCSFKFK